MNIAIIFDLTERGGVQTCVFSLIRGLNKINIIPTIMWDQEPNPELLSENGVLVEFQRIRFVFPSSFIKNRPNPLRYILWPFNGIRISKIPERFSFVFSFYPFLIVDISRPHLFYLSGPPLLPQLEPKAKKFKIIKTLYRFLIRPFYAAYDPQLNANYVINSEFTARLFTEAHGKEIEVIYPSNQLVFKKPEKIDLINRDTVTFFSRIVDYKRPELLIELSDLYPSMCFVIMGGVSKNKREYFSYLELLAKQKKINNLKFYPNASRQQIDEILNKTRFYVFSAVKEHFGITTVEAIAKGCIPFVHNSGGQKEIVPIDELRFEDDDFHRKFENLTKRSDDTLQRYRIKLFDHCQRFTEETFIIKMLQKLPFVPNE